MEARKERKAGRPLPPLDLAASSSWPDLDTSAGPSPDLNADLVPVDLNADLVPVDLNAAASWPPLDITAGPLLDITAGPLLDLNAETPAGRPKKRRTGKPSTGPGKPLESAEMGQQ